MDIIISDNAKAQLSDYTKDILRMYAVKDWQSEPYNKNQNSVREVGKTQRDTPTT